jgi:ADP-dependent NAD(P)H-hydrate dehydratase
MSEIVAIDAALLKRTPLPAVSDDDDKKDRGSLFIIAGGASIPGAGLLVAHAAFRVGVGRLQLAAPAASATVLGIAMPEAQIHRASSNAAGEFAASTAEELRDPVEAADAVILGPGMIDENDAASIARVLAKRPETKLVLDAGALTGLAGSREKLGAKTVLTPHAGELAKLMQRDASAIRSDPGHHALEAARRFGATMTLKGATTYVATAKGELYRLSAPCPGLGVSGSGDVLAGIIGGLLARGANSTTAALWGVSIHARAGALLSDRVGALGFLAREIASECAAALRDLEQQS